MRVWYFYLFITSLPMRWLHGLYEIIGNFFLFFLQLTNFYILAIEGQRWRQRRGLESMHLEHQVHISFFFLFSTKSTSTYIECHHLTLHTITIWTTIAQPIQLQWMGRITKWMMKYYNVTQNMYNLL